MANLLSVIALGFFLGMRHATDPDHVIAVSTIVSRQANVKRAALVGTFWGIGHTVTILIVGTIIILFRIEIPARTGLSMELAVGLMLIILGYINVGSFFRSVPSGPVSGHSGAIHSHAHCHGDYIHSHVHGHEPEAHSHSADHTPVSWMDRKFGGLRVYQHLRPLTIGIVHGLAGSAAVAWLVLLTIGNTRWAIAYLVVFGIGTVAGMILITLSIASTLRLFGRTQQFFRRLALASGVLSLSFGVVLAYQICIRSGLLMGAPRWTPH